MVGPLPVTSQGNKWILVLSDHFTRWHDALPIPDATAPTIASTLDTKVFSVLGLPEEIHSDRGTQFESDLLSELCNLWGVMKTRTTPYHPQANGVVERGNRTIGDSIRCLLNSGIDKEWDLVLPQVMRNLRATPHQFTEESANFLMFGRELRLPDQLVYHNSKIEPIQSTSDYCTQLIDTLQEAHDCVRQFQHGYLLSHASNEDEPLFAEGELVLVDNRLRKKGINPKLQPKFTGPFPITKVYPNGTYRLEGIKSVINECRLKRFYVSPSTSLMDSETTATPRGPVSDIPGSPPPPMNTTTKEIPIRKSTRSTRQPDYYQVRP